MARHPIVYVFASGTSNTFLPVGETAIKAGIALQEDIRSNLPNGLANLEQSAIRELQTMGGFYDNNQTYNTGDFVTQLISENGIFRIVYYRCKKDSTTQKPPLTGTNVGTADIPVLSNITAEDLVTWDRVFFETKNKTTFSNGTNQRNVVLISSANKDKVLGKLKVRTKGSGTAGWDVCFDIEFFGSASEFKISNVYYSDRVRKSSNIGNNIPIAHIGFCLDVQTSGELHLWCYNVAYCSSFEFDFSELNCPIVASTTTLQMTKPYAIIEGGGVIRQGLGTIKNDYRTNSTPASGETYAFYLFKNGYVRWTSAITLNSTYFHQWANGGFGSLNIDASDKYLCNVGSKVGQNLGTIKKAELPNFIGKIKNSGVASPYSVWNNNGDSGWNVEGAFRKENAARLYRATAGTTTDTNSDLVLDPSNNNPIYKNSGGVFGDCIPSFLVAQAF